jgi:predicted alpha/beta hydrolase
MPNPAPGPAAQAAPARTLTESPVGIAAPGDRLAGTLIAASDPEVAVLIAAATGVPAAFYRPFARWLAETIAPRS